MEITWFRSGKWAVHCGINSAAILFKCLLVESNLRANPFNSGEMSTFCSLAYLKFCTDSLFSSYLGKIDFSEFVRHFRKYGGRTEIGIRPGHLPISTWTPWLCNTTGCQGWTSDEEKRHEWVYDYTVSYRVVCLHCIMGWVYDYSVMCLHCIMGCGVSTKHYTPVSQGGMIIISVRSQSGKTPLYQQFIPPPLVSSSAIPLYSVLDLSQVVPVCPAPHSVVPQPDQTSGWTGDPDSPHAATPPLLGPLCSSVTTTRWEGGER